VTRPVQDPLPGALDALVAVTSVPETPGRADFTLREYLTRILAAAEGRAGALWVPETLEDQGGRRSRWSGALPGRARRS
jgi:hypothetical protein